MDYFVPTEDAQAEFVERRSKFIGRIFCVENEEEALERLGEVRDKHWDATHNVYAYIIKDGAIRYSDDGEPQGTAGMPVLDVLRKNEVFNVLCTVTRYFGGVLLGGGGLVRAYSNSAKLALDASGISVVKLWSLCRIACSYSHFDRLKAEIERLGGLVEKADYTENVVISAVFPEKIFEEAARAVQDITSGESVCEFIENRLKAFPVTD